MSEPVEISDALLLDAQRTAAVAQRTISEQIEFWAQLGRAVEPLLEGSRAPALQKSGAAVPLSKQFATIDSAEGRMRVAEFLAAGPYPHYEPVPDTPGVLERIEADGARTVGRFVGRQFQASE